MLPWSPIKLTFRAIALSWFTKTVLGEHSTPLFNIQVIQLTFYKAFASQSLAIPLAAVQQMCLLTGRTSLNETTWSFSFAELEVYRRTKRMRRWRSWCASIWLCRGFRCHYGEPTKSRTQTSRSSTKLEWPWSGRYSKSRLLHVSMVYA